MVLYVNRTQLVDKIYHPLGLTVFFFTVSIFYLKDNYTYKPLVNMVYFNLVTVAVVLNAVAISVLAYPDPANWGKCTTQRYSGIEWEPARDIVYQHLSNACSGWSGHRGAYQEVYRKLTILYLPTHLPT
jgi:hypothetical protein